MHFTFFLLRRACRVDDSISQTKQDAAVLPTRPDQHCVASCRYALDMQPLTRDYALTTTSTVQQTVAGARPTHWRDSIPMSAPPASHAHHVKPDMYELRVFVCWILYYPLYLHFIYNNLHHMLHVSHCSTAVCLGCTLSQWASDLRLLRKERYHGRTLYLFDISIP